MINHFGPLQCAHGTCDPLCGRGRPVSSRWGSGDHHVVICHHAHGARQVYSGSVNNYEMNMIRCSWGARTTSGGVPLPERVGAGSAARMVCHDCMGMHVLFDSRGNCTLQVCVWDAETAKLVYQLPGHTGKPCTSYGMALVAHLLGWAQAWSTTWCFTPQSLSWPAAAVTRRSSSASWQREGCAGRCCRCPAAV